MGTERVPSLLQREDRLLVAADESDDVGELCIDFILKDSTREAAAVAVTSGRNSAALLDRWQRSGRGRFRDLSVLAVGGADRSVAADGASQSALGLVQSLDESITVTELVERIQGQLQEWAADEVALGVYVDSLDDWLDPKSYIELIDRLSSVLSAHGGVGVFRVSPDVRALAAIRSRFGAVIELDSDGVRTAPTEEPVPTEELFDALGTRRRWRVLRYLLGRRDEPTDVDELARALVREDPSEEAVQKRYVGLVHSDLPVLADLGVVTFERSRSVVEPTDRIGSVEPFLALADAESTQQV
ncbi:hypothetical protein HUG10_05445 [Halorarum halophilum]|uniref:DUF7344 domain-containing protein n=1 Tax=Halorarum halophilum TaxID=2743090 RepID=A0A7D5K6T9_9EURY|nr:hypothetical protein [Halobaculum halophilum]QLG27019.1 hypothetical protein HUG10_05445 [Halobaculum halophilum]